MDKITANALDVRIHDSHHFTPLGRHVLDHLYGVGKLVSIPCEISEIKKKSSVYYAWV